MNPITQMKQRKTTPQTTKTGADCTMTASTQPTTPPTVKPAENRNQRVLGNSKKLTLLTYPQVDYLFQQAKWSAANCKLNYPDCFHLKQAQRKELIQICKILHGSDRLLRQLANGASLTDEERLTMKKHKRLVGYLTRQMQGVADYIDQVEQAEGEQLDALCYRKDESRTDEYRGK